MSVECTIYATRADDVAGAQNEILDRLEDRPSYGLGKAWDAVHFALGRHDDDHPLAFIESGGSDVEALDDGVMASGRYFDALAVVRIAAALAEVPEDEVRTNFARRDSVADPDELYPSGLRPFSADHVVREISGLRRFLADVVAQSRGILVYTSG